MSTDPRALTPEKAHLLIIPGSPALVEELAPGDAPSKRLAATARRAAGQGGDDTRPVDIVCPLGEAAFTRHTGSFAAWGAPQVTVGGGNHLGEIIARYLLGDHTYRPARDTITPLDPQALTVVVVDGPAGLTPRAPLAFIESAPAVHEALEVFLNTGAGLPSTSNMRDAGVFDPELWSKLAQLQPARCELLDSDSSLGVGRYVAAWEVAC